MLESAVQIEELVKELYRPGSAIEPIQRRLQEAQRTNGWTLALELLKSEDQNVRFFAALTFTVKINQEGSTLAEGDLKTLLSSLIHWLVTATTGGETVVVIRKICSTLVTLALLHNSPWRLYIRHLICCLSGTAAVPEEETIQYPDTHAMLKNLGPLQMVSVLTFVRILAEDAVRTDHTAQNDGIHQRMELNLSDAVAVLECALSGIQSTSTQCSDDTLQCYHSWINYVRQEYDVGSDNINKFHALTVLALRCLLVEDLFSSTAELFTDLFSADEGFLEYADVMSFAQLLQSHWASCHLSTLEADHQNEESLEFSLLTLAFAQGHIKHIIRNPGRFQGVLDIVVRITASQYFNTVTQNLANAIADFWETYNAEASEMCTGSDEVKVLFDTARLSWLHAMEVLCQGIMLPLGTDGEFKRLGSDHPFSELRWRVQDVIHSSYEVYQSAIFEKLISLVECVEVTRAADNSLWSRLEAVCYCMVGLGEYMKYQVSDVETEDDQLRRLFGSSLYTQLTNSDIPIPSKVRKHALGLIGEHDGFLGRHVDFLLGALDMLFLSLQHRSCAETAARAIYTLCAENRKILSTRLPALMVAAEQVYGGKEFNLDSKEFVLASVAAISQALPEEHMQVKAFGYLLDTLETYWSRVSSTLSNGSHEIDNSQPLQVSVLGQLKAIGNAWRAPESDVIDLDEEEDDAAHERPWDSTQIRLMQLLTNLCNESLIDALVVDGICEVLQTGYRETKSGPFTFPPQVTVDIIVSLNRETPRLDAVLKTAATFVSSQSRRLENDTTAIPTLLAWLNTIVSPQLNAEDPELAHAGVEVLVRLIPKQIHHLSQLPLEVTDNFIRLSLSSLAGTEALPKRAAATFWINLLDSTSPLTKQLLSAYGAQLIHILIFAYGGNGARSELEHLTQPFRKIVFKYSQDIPWKLWTEQALVSADFPSERATEADKKRFVAQVERLRGDKRTATVVRDFWLLCRGTPAGYG